MDRQVIVLVGAYGSGKTEIALNFARSLSKEKKTVLADLDIVNPYFRSSEKIREMEELGVEIIAPVYANTNVDSPMLSPKVGGYFVYQDINYIIDAGGDPVGAKALGQYRYKILENGGKLLFVINTNRPFTNDVSSIMEMISLVEGSSSMKVSGLIHNSNMSYESTGNELVESFPVIEQVSRETGVPLVLTCGQQKAIDAYKQAGLPGETMVITRFMGIDKW